MNLNYVRKQTYVQKNVDKKYVRYITSFVIINYSAVCVNYVKTDNILMKVIFCILGEWS